MRFKPRRYEPLTLANATCAIEICFRAGPVGGAGPGMQSHEDEVILVSLLNGATLLETLLDPEIVPVWLIMVRCVHWHLFQGKSALCSKTQHLNRQWSAHRSLQSTHADPYGVSPELSPPVRSSAQRIGDALQSN
jgi:hypothetical protein